MRRLLAALLFFCSVAVAANFKLYLADGTFHLVKEYKVEGGRVRYYSIERSDWEEMPAELVDLKRTESEKADHAKAIAEETKIISEEDKAARAIQDEVLKIPQDPGVYALDDGKTLRIFKLAESTLHTNKGRQVLKVLSPVPLVPGKATLEIPESHSLNILNLDRPELYIQLSKEERFGLVKLTPHGSVRVVERVAIVPVSKEAIEEVDEVKVFRKQLTESWLYKIWPEEALAPGEYAVIQYTPGKLDTQIWDFQVKK
jgi:hypothetical protein